MLLAPSLLLGGLAHPTVSAALGAAAWMTGEYAEHVRDPRGVLEALLQPNVTALPAGVQAVYVQVRPGNRLVARPEGLKALQTQADWLRNQVDMLFEI